jgi:sulfatase modifying factor 1
MGRSDNGSDAFSQGDPIEQPEHQVTLKPYALDKYEVTGARFARFLLAYKSWRKAGNPAKDAGSSPNLEGSGWQPTVDEFYLNDSSELPADLVSNCVNQIFQLFGINEGGDLAPRNCINWGEARAFCAWDGGWLPTEAEWEFAAAGGQENRLYPWGNAAPDSNVNATFSVDVYHVPQAVGLRPAGDGLYGHADLAGSLSEMTMGAGNVAYSAGACSANCGAIPAQGAPYALRGGNCSVSLNYHASYLRAAARDYNADRSWPIGFRCARALPK